MRTLTPRRRAACSTDQPARIRSSSSIVGSIGIGGPQAIGEKVRSRRNPKDSDVEGPSGPSPPEGDGFPDSPERSRLRLPPRVPWLLAGLIRDLRWVHGQIRRSRRPAAPLRVTGDTTVKVVELPSLHDEMHRFSHQQDERPSE